jgi:hypothetical protein
MHTYCENIRLAKAEGKGGGINGLNRKGRGQHQMNTFSASIKPPPRDDDPRRRFKFRPSSTKSSL